MPDTDQAWMTAALIKDKRKIKKIKAEIMQEAFPLLNASQGFVVNLGLRKEWVKQQARRAQTQKASEKRWNGDANASVTESVSDPLAMQTVSPSSTSSTVVKEIYKEKVSKRFKKPTLEELKDYGSSISYLEFDPERFVDHYESNGWKVGKSPMKDWKAAVRTWKRNDNETQKGNSNDKSEPKGDRVHEAYQPPSREESAPHRYEVTDAQREQYARDAASGNYDDPHIKLKRNAARKAAENKP